MPKEPTNPSESTIKPPLGGPGGGAALPGAHKEGGQMNPKPGPIKPADLPADWIPSPKEIPTEIMEMFTAAWKKNPQVVRDLLRSIIEHP